MPDTEQRDDLWGPLDVRRWGETPSIAGRSAVEEDVRSGRAAFYIDGPSEPLAVLLPACGLLHDDHGQMLPVIVIQAEQPSGGSALIGYRPLSGGNGICTFDEVDLLDGPDDRFI